MGLGFEVLSLVLAGLAKVQVALGQEHEGNIRSGNLKNIDHLGNCALLGTLKQVQSKMPLADLKAFASS